MAFSPDGSRIAANLRPGSLNLWDLGPASGLAVEPEAGDVAGWLRRSRALAEQDDAAGAEAASARARDITGSDASPWIEHAVWLYRRGDCTRGTGRPGAAMEALPDDPGRGSTSAGARTHRLDGGVGDGPGAGPVALRAAALPAATTTRRPPPWPSCSRRPTIGGLDRPPARRDDLRRGCHPDPAARRLGPGRRPKSRVDTYTVEATSDWPGSPASARGPPRPEPARTGPGRAKHRDGHFLLTSIRLSTVAGPSAPVPIDLTRARADIRTPTFARARSGAIDADPSSLVDLAARGPYLIGRLPGRATDRADPRHETARGTGLWSSRVRPTHTLGRFRLSVTDRPFPLFEPSLAAIKADARAERPDPARGGLRPPRRLGAGRRRAGPGRGAARRDGPRRLPAGPGPPSPGPAR